MNFDDNFKEFWALYPRRAENPPISRRKDAYKKLQTIIRDKEATWDEILDGVRLYAHSDKVKGKNATGKKFICMPTTWLNQARWEDEYQEPTINFRQIPRQNWTDDHWREAFGDVKKPFNRASFSEERWNYQYYGPRPPHPDSIVPPVIQDEYRIWWPDLKVVNW